jgi:tetratricopeptide (TPR) repeat protein
MTPPTYDPSDFSAPSDEVEIILESAIRSADDGDWQVMIGMLSDGLEVHPEDLYLLCWLGLAEMEIGEDGAAYERFKRVLATNPQDPVLLATAGNAVAAFDDPDAEGALRTAVLLAPDLPQARWMYGAYLSREGLTKEALEQFDVAVELDPEDPLIQTERGVAQALAVGNGKLHGRDLTVGHGHAPASSEQVKRPFQCHRRLVSGTGLFLTPFERHVRIGPERGLQPQAARDVDPGSRRSQRRLLLQCTGYRLLQRQPVHRIEIATRD